MIATLLIFRDAILGEIFPREVIGDAVRQQQGKPALQVVGVEKTQLDDEFMTFSRPDAYHLPKEDEQVIKDISNDAWRPIIEHARVESLSPEVSTWRISLRGQRNQGLRILNIEVVDVTRKPPLAGTLFWIPPQGGEPSELMAINLDEVNPIVRVASVNGSGVQFDGPYFPSKTIALKDKEEVVVVLRAVTRKNTVSFKLKFDFQLGDQRESIDVDDNGQPFRLTAYSCNDGLLDYRSFYSLGGGLASQPYGIYPTRPEGADRFVCD